MEISSHARYSEEKTANRQDRANNNKTAAECKNRTKNNLTQKRTVDERFTENTNSLNLCNYQHHSWLPQPPLNHYMALINARIVPVKANPHPHRNNNTNNSSLKKHQLTDLTS